MQTICWLFKSYGRLQNSCAAYSVAVCLLAVLCFDLFILLKWSILLDHFWTIYTYIYVLCAFLTLLIHGCLCLYFINLLFSIMLFWDWLNFHSVSALKEWFVTCMVCRNFNELTSSSEHIYWRVSFHCVCANYLPGCNTIIYSSVSPIEISETYCKTSAYIGVSSEYCIEFCVVLVCVANNILCHHEMFWNISLFI